MEGCRKSGKKERMEETLRRKGGMKEIRYERKEGFRTGGIHEKRDSGSGGIQDERDSGKKGYRKGGKKAGGFRTECMRNRRDAGKVAW